MPGMNTLVAWNKLHVDSIYVPCWSKKQMEHGGCAHTSQVSIEHVPKTFTPYHALRGSWMVARVMKSLTLWILREGNALWVEERPGHLPNDG
ncbi:hypothetical protein LIER_13087 [Lithospermum erythrorhizon]|uniref:Uncharacterized protein n=1 Tax=Lithospermum erythrorhizon TaxID=34254 RepID=A0AAV3PVM3_LITER